MAAVASLLGVATAVAAATGVATVAVFATVVAVEQEVALGGGCEVVDTGVGVLLDSLTGDLTGVLLPLDTPPC